MMAMPRLFKMSTVVMLAITCGCSSPRVLTTDKETYIISTSGGQQQFDLVHIVRQQFFRYLGYMRLVERTGDSRQSVLAIAEDIVHDESRNVMHRTGDDTELSRVVDANSIRESPQRWWLVSLEPFILAADAIGFDKVTAPIRENTSSPLGYFIGGEFNVWIPSEATMDRTVDTLLVERISATTKRAEMERLDLESPLTIRDVMGSDWSNTRQNE